MMMRLSLVEPRVLEVLEGRMEEECSDGPEDEGVKEGVGRC